MIFSRRLRALIWKEVIETLRDKRTIGLMALSALLLPALGLLIAGLRAQQVAPVVIENCDGGNESQVLVRRLLEAFNSTGMFQVIVFNATENTTCSPPPGFVFAVIILPGFTANATSLNKPILVAFKSLVGSVAASQAESIANNVLYNYSEEKASKRVAILAGKAGVEIEPGIILHPVRVVKETVTAKGVAAPPGLAERIGTARFLSFSVFFVLNPAAIAVADAFIRERERGTAELIAASPVRGRELIVAKLIGGTILSLIAAAVDALAVLAYIILLASTPTAAISLTPDLALVHSVQILLAVLVTAALAAPIALRAPTPRSATLGTTLLTGIATAIFFSSLFVDLDKLPSQLLALLLAVPYTHTVLAITSYALGNMYKTLLHSIIILVLAAGLTVLAARLYNPEKYVRRI